MTNLKVLKKNKNKKSTDWPKISSFPLEGKQTIFFLGLIKCCVWLSSAVYGYQMLCVVIKCCVCLSSAVCGYQVLYVVFKCCVWLSVLYVVIKCCMWLSSAVCDFQVLSGGVWGVCGCVGVCVWGVCVQHIHPSEITALEIGNSDHIITVMISSHNIA